MPAPRIAATLSLLLASCTVAVAGSPFEGKWEGPWASRVQGLSGSFALTIDATGAVTGTTVYGANHGTVSGRIDAAGNLDATYTYGVVPYRAKAHFTRAGDHLRGTATYSLPLGVPFDDGPVDLTRH